MAEWSRLRHTGLSELSRLPSVVEAANKSGQRGVLWSKAHLIVPRYATHEAPAFNQADANHCEQISTAIAPKIVKGTQIDRIVADLPTNITQWEAYADAVVPCIAQLAGSSVFHVLCIDWPMAPILTRLKSTPNCRTCFTVDLLPEDPAARGLWNAGLAAAHSVHVATPYWRDRLAEQEPALKAKTCVFVVLGIQEETCEVSQKARHKQALLGQRWPNAPEGDIFFVVRNRLTKADQKNYAGLTKVLPVVIAEAARCSWSPKFLIGPLGDQAETQFQPIMSGLSDLAQKYPNNIWLESPEETKSRAWSTVLKACDSVIVPSIFEPCGINHAQAMQYHAVPVCSRIGAMGQRPMSERNSFQYDVKDGEAGLTRSLMAACHTYYERRIDWSIMTEAAFVSSKYYVWQNLLSDYGKLFG